MSRPLIGQTEALTAIGRYLVALGEFDTYAKALGGLDEMSPTEWLLIRAAYLDDALGYLEAKASK